MRKNVVKKILQVSVSPKFTAILDCMLQVEPRRTDPPLAKLIAGSSGGFLGMREGEIGHNDFLGSLFDLEANLVGVAEVAGLTEEETDWLLSQAPGGTR